MDSQTSTNAAAREWAVLQPLYERYEFGALTIKLTAVVLFFGGIVVELHAAWLMLLIAVLIALAITAAYIGFMYLSQRMGAA